MKKKETILLVGVGLMGIEYAKVLQALNMPFVAVGRGEKSASDFSSATGLQPITGGIEKYIQTAKDLPSMAIVAVNEDEAGRVTRFLLKNGLDHILAEKPGGLTIADIKLTGKVAKKFKASVYIAYNRRFYASTIEAMRIIKKDGGISSFTFDFTERSYVIEKLETSSVEVKRNWFLANSTHVIDMAFFLGGKPSKIATYKKGGLKWHPSGFIYAGAGISDRGAPFSYHADWESAGRWSIEVMTPKNKLIFRPLEKLQMQKYGSMNIEDVPLDDKLDIEFKPGIYRQIESFLGDKRNLLTINEQVKNLQYYSAIRGK